MKKQRILVVSSANIDFVQRMRRMPYSGETVCEPELGYSYVPGGKGANSAVAFARMGADCVFQCKLGRDSNAKRLISFYQREGIDTRYIKEDENSATGLASILVEDCYPDAVYLQFEIPDEAAIEATRRANEEGIPVFIDAGPARLDFPLSRLGKIEIFSPNESETRVFTGIAPTSEENALRAAIKLSSMVDAKYIVIKLGDRGSFIYDKKEYYVIPSEKVDVVDTTAAGDVFTAVMTYVYLSNKNIISAVKYATCAAALSVTKAGASSSIPTRAEVIAYAKNKVAAENGTADNADAVVKDEAEEK